MAGELKSIREKLSSEWTEQEKLELSNKYMDAWDKSSRLKVKEAAMHAGIKGPTGSYAACADQYLTRGDWNGFVACLESAAKSANLKTTYKSLFRG